MPKIYVKKPFKLQHQDKDGAPTMSEFAVGNHDVPAAIAAHWFVKAHVGEEPEAGPEDDADLAEQRATLESAAQMLEGRADQLALVQDELDAKAKALQELADKLADREKAAEQREADLNARAEALDAREVAIAEREKADATAKAGKAK